LFELRIDWGLGCRNYYAMLDTACHIVNLWRRRAKTVARHRTVTRISKGQQGKDRNRMKRKASLSYDEAMVRRLRKDPDFAAEYLKAALEDSEEPRVLLIALRHLALAQGIAKVAKAAGIERESLYRALSIRGNPRLSTLVAVTKAIGLKLTVEAAP
jgi:probable addiction module antidote protein